MNNKTKVQIAYKAIGDKLLSDAEWKAWFIKEYGSQWNYSYQMLDGTCISLAQFIHDRHPEFDYMFKAPPPADWDDIPIDLRTAFKEEILEDLRGRGYEVYKPTDYTVEMAMESWVCEKGESEVVDYILKTRYTDENRNQEQMD